MSVLEREIIEKFHQLDRDARKRVRELIMGSEEQAAVFDYDAWFRDVESLRQEIRASHGNKPMDVVGMLRDIREGEDE